MSTKKQIKEMGGIHETEYLLSFTTEKPVIHYHVYDLWGCHIG